MLRLDKTILIVTLQILLILCVVFLVLINFRINVEMNTHIEKILYIEMLVLLFSQRINLNFSIDCFN